MAERLPQDLAARAASASRETVFREPWQARAFAIALMLSQGGAYRWDDFRRILMAEVGSSDADYYRNFLAALEKLLIAKGMLGAEELRRRIAELAGP